MFPYLKSLAMQGRRFLALVLSLCLTLLSSDWSLIYAQVSPAWAAPLNLPQLQWAPPESLGKVTDYFNADASSGKRVILIQDLHAHYGVQKNIAGILEFLSRTPFSLAVEGAQGDIDTSFLARYPESPLKRETLDYLMREGELTGMEYFAAMHGMPHLLFGVEDERYYSAHRDLFRHTFHDRTTLVGMLRGIEIDLKILRPSLYGPALTMWQNKLDAFDKGQLSAPEFINLLTPHATADQLQDFPSLKAFLQNGGTNAAQPERWHQLTTDFLAQVQDRLSVAEKATLALLAKKEGTNAYYAYLRDLIYQHDLFIAVPLELAKHLEYLHTVQTSGFDRVLQEAEELAYRTKQHLARTQQEKDFVQVEHDLALLLKIADLQATEYEIEAFAPRLNALPRYAIRFSCITSLKRSMKRLFTT